MSALEGLEKVYGEADIAVSFELGENPYGRYVARKIVDSELDHTRIDHDLKEWRPEVIRHFVEIIKDEHPFNKNPEQTAWAGLLICIDAAVHERRAEVAINGSA